VEAEEKSLAECRSRKQSTSHAWSAVESGGGGRSQEGHQKYFLRSWLTKGADKSGK
jgi:hypothetical protein